ncbi:MAG: bifunctional demethylmenaquinone methyltransferase/2-methoxy-6-polyprenyl-1,4-benzoquinol methylase UbiE [Bacteroidaceae bacterium]|nr:bifunctional demethylmenaquinone methyltransferase/2-methoxy-6-polyprenyl-1,4-benzoquinol methylase UbiE [Bacteroidaceae bacterium]
MASPIASIFNRIAPHYDLLNHLLSFNIDKRWRKKALKGHVSKETQTALDIACGTGDFALALHKKGVQHINGVDISEKMVEVGQVKVAKKGLSKQIELATGDCAALAFSDNTFDVITVAFGVRNFEQRAKSLEEMHRVLAPKGETIILEFSTPQHFPMKQLYGFYFKSILPCVGGLISGDKAAYTYLPNSVYAFPQGDLFMQEMRAAGFTKVSNKRMTFGIASIYYGHK